MAKKKPAPVHLGPVCGGCRWYLADSDEQGHCMAMPPTVVVDDMQEPWAVRPVVNVDEPQCMFFTQRLNS